MKNLKRSLLSVLLIIAILASSIITVSAAGTQPSKYSTTNNSGTRHVVASTLDGTSAASYYTGSYTYERLEELSASTLLTTLRGLMTSTHKTKTSYANCRDYANKTDCENGSGTNIITIYTSYSSSHSEYNGGNGWNREHVWPKSLGGFDTDGAGADLHHIRPSENRTNSNRGNKLYGNVNGGTKSTGNLSGEVGGYYTSSYYEPLDEVKGDVARICLYVYVRYGAEYTQCSKITNVFQSVDVLLEWCELDPVDTWEMGRNEVVGAIQGNRNVFIDYPELAWLIFDKEVPSDMVTPSGYAMGGNVGGDDNTGDDNTGDDNNGGNAGDDSGETACTHTATEIKNKVEATCTEAGYTGDKYCKSCGEKLSAGTAVAAKGHSFGEWVTNSYGTQKTRTCSVCNTTETEQIKVENCDHPSTVLKNNRNASCGHDGYTGDLCCEKCGEVMQKGKTIPKTGDHVWASNPTSVVDPTENELGEATYKCYGCDATKTEPISNYTEAEEIVATISWNAVYALLNSFLTKA